jgi:hypothetical protein
LVCEMISTLILRTVYFDLTFLISTFARRWNLVGGVRFSPPGLLSQMPFIYSQSPRLVLAGALSTALAAAIHHVQVQGDENLAQGVGALLPRSCCRSSLVFIHRALGTSWSASFSIMSMALATADARPSRANPKSAPAG